MHRRRGEPGTARPTSVHWHAGSDGRLVTVADENGPDAADPRREGRERLVGFAVWEDARDCLLFAIDDDARAGRPSPPEVARSLGQARAGWSWTARGPRGAWWILVCHVDACGAEVIAAPGTGGSPHEEASGGGR